MKTSLDHLPAHKQEELRIVKEAILEFAKPVMIILYGSYSRGDWVEDKYVEDGITYVYKSDFDILVVTAHQRDIQFWHSKRIKKRARQGKLVQTPISIDFETIESLNHELTEGNFFFTDIAKEGTFLYNSGEFQLATPRPLSKEDRIRRAKLHYDVWMTKAEESIKAHQLMKKEGLLSWSIFQLHQAAESLYHCLILIKTDYKPKTHDLEDLGKQARILDSKFKAVFPCSTPEEERLYKLL